MSTSSPSLRSSSEQQQQQQPSDRLKSAQVGGGEPMSTLQFHWKMEAAFHPKKSASGLGGAEGGAAAGEKGAAEVTVAIDKTATSPPYWSDVTAQEKEEAAAWTSSLDDKEILRPGTELPLRLSYTQHESGKVDTLGGQFERSTTIYSSSSYVPRRLSISDRKVLERVDWGPTASWSHRPSSASTVGEVTVTHQAHNRRLVPLNQPIARVGGFKQLTTEPTEVFTITYSPDARQLAVGCGDGSIRLFSTAASGYKPHALQVIAHPPVGPLGLRLPTTCLRFNPAPDGRVVGSMELHDADAQLLLVAGADGFVSTWSVNTESAQVLHRTRVGGVDNSVYAIDIQSDGVHWVCGGRDSIVRFCDTVSGKVVRQCENRGYGNGHGHGHSNRIYSVKFHPTDAHLVVSGGWDNTLQFWDDRTGYSERSIYGPHLAGDALDISFDGRTILTGSWREEDALQRWDFRMGKLIDTIEWNGGGGKEAESQVASTRSVQHPSTSLSCMLYSACYSPDSKLIAAGGSGNGLSQAKIFDAATGQPTDRVSFQHPFYSLAFSPDGQQLAMGGVDQNLTIVSL